MLAIEKDPTKHYAGMFPNFEMFCQVMDQCTENYECLVIHNNAKSNKLTDHILYKAEPHDDFRLCNQEHWQYSATNEEKLREEGNNLQQNTSKYQITKSWS